MLKHACSHSIVPWVLSTRIQLKMHAAKRRSTPPHPKALPEMATTSNCANRRCHAEGEPPEPVLTLTLSAAKGKGKDGVVGVRVFPDTQCQAATVSNATCK
jgi:hypothetical protein